jgi:hypothetical protein
MPDLTQAEYRRLKTRLTTRENKFKKAAAAHREARPVPSATHCEVLLEAAKQLRAEAVYGLAQFEKLGSPDQWSRWERAKDDAQSQIHRLERL